MAIRYGEALGILKQVAEGRFSREDGRDIEFVPLEDVVGRTAGRDHVSPAATPLFDASTVDGYAISATATSNATKKRPVTFIVRGTITSGDESINSPPSGGGIPSCFEIKAGAAFPKYTTSNAVDACVKAEDVVITAFGSQKMITITEPVVKNANKRAAGSDIRSDQMLLQEGEMIQPRHVMALASAGIATVAVRRNVRAAIWSTGEEVFIQSSHSKSRTMDTNIMFLAASFRQLGMHSNSEGVLKGNTDDISRTLLQQAESGAYDLIVTVGAVTSEGSDLATALKSIGARKRFDSVAIQPGHSVLFATIPTPFGDIPLLALPTNPVATAACFRFLVAPLITQLSGVRHDVPKILRMQAKSEFRDLSLTCPPHLDCFKHGWIQKNDRGEEFVELSPDQNPAKVSHFAASDCWVHIPKGHSGSYRDTLVYCYAHSPSKSS